MTHAALEFALERHAGQLRDGDHAPFVLHPLEVGALLSAAGYPEYVVATGVLHDVLEDTDTDAAELEILFGRLSLPSSRRSVTTRRSENSPPERRHCGPR
jgi:guanosine-3',5'-bis(diphosphate) 3'-pyrophosphohydrolase